MKTLNTYLFRNMLATVLMALGIMTFVMLSGHFYKAFSMLSQGVSPVVLCRFIGYMLPYTLCFTLPLALLVSTVLVFSRLSGDNEVVAMKAIGISLWQIISPALLLSAVISIVCLWLSLFVSPLCRYKAEQLLATATAETPLAMLEPGVFAELFPRCYIRVGAKSGSELKDIHIVIRDRDGRVFKDVVARSGRLERRGENVLPELLLSEAEVTDFTLDGVPEPSRVTSVAVGSVSMPLDFGAMRSAKKTSRKAKYMDLRMLCARIVLDREDGLDVTSMFVNLHERLAMSVAPFSFLLLGLPFGIKSRRSELSIGLLICVLLALFFYAFVLLTNTLKEMSGMHPQYIIWIPNLLYQGAGLLMMRRLEYRG